MRRDPNIRPENLLQLALDEIDRLKVMKTQITDGSGGIILTTPGSAPGTGLGTIPGAVEAGPHILYGTKHTRSLAVTASTPTGGVGYSAQVLLDSPNAYWRLGETVGSFVDSAPGATNPGTANGGMTRGVTGAISGDSDKAVELNGTTGFVSVADNSELDLGDIFTIEAWIKKATNGTSMSIVAKGSSGYQLRMSTANTLQLLKENVSVIVSSTTTITDTAYHHVVATKTGATVNLYIDGVNVTGVVTNATIANTLSPLHIGRRSAASDEFFNGTIDEVAVYPTVLTAAQVLNHFIFGGINVDIEQGQVWINAVFFSIAATTLPMVNATTNYVFVNIAGAVASNTTGFPTDSIPLATVVTAGGIVTSVNDRRSYLTAGVTGGGATTHEILSATHTDSLVSAVSRGSIIVGNSTPAWAEVIIGVAGSIFRSDGTDPAWTINPTIAGYVRVGSAAAPANTTAGDLTCARLFVGNVAIEAEGRLVQVRDTYVNALDEVKQTVDVVSTFQPGANHAGLNAVRFAVLAEPTAAFTGVITAIRAQAIHQGGAGVSMVRLSGQEMEVSQNLAATTISAMLGERVAMRALAGTVSTMVAFDIQRGAAGDVGAIGSSVGLRIQPHLAPVPTDDVAIQSQGGRHVFVGDVKIGADSPAGVALDVAGSEWISTYLRVGMLAAPTNITAGDLTVVRLFVGADATILGGLSGQIAGALGISGNAALRLYDADNSNFIGHRANAARTTDIVYVWPVTDPTAGQILSSTAPAAGVAALSWVTGGETDLELRIPLANPIVASAATQLEDWIHKKPYNVGHRINKLYARAASNVGGDVTFKIQKNGVDIAGAVVTIPSGARVPVSATPVAFTEADLADADVLTVVQTTARVDAINISIYIYGDRDVVGVVA